MKAVPKLKKPQFSSKGFNIRTKATQKLQKPDSSSKLYLENIIGLTTKNSNGLASSIFSKNCVYVAGCIVVVYNVDLSAQSHLVVSHRMPKPLSCVALSPDGHFIAAGESGNQPAVLVWDNKTHAFVSELKGHPFGVTCIAFSPDGKHMVSVGGYICLWDWRSGMLVTKLKASSSHSLISSVTFTSDGKYIVTAGRMHLKFWSIRSSQITRLSNGTGLMTMTGKPVILGIQKGSSFVSVTSPIWTDRFVHREQSRDFFPVYALTDSGTLCLVHSGLSVIKKVDLKVEKGFSLSVSDKLIACACNNGIVKIFAVDTLKYVVTVRYSKSKNLHGECEIGYPSESSENVDQHAATLPDAVACQFLTPEMLVVVYGDRTLCIWDVHDVNKASRSIVLVSHSSRIWDIKNILCENMHDPSTACAGRGCYGGVSFATCSVDGTIRLWDLALQSDSADKSVNQHQKFKAISTTHLVNAGIYVRDTVQPGIITKGFRSMTVSPDGKYLAAGDCEGNLHIYDLETWEYTFLEDAHDAEILSLSFSFANKKDAISGDGAINYYLASGSQDRRIQLYDVKRDFHLTESIDDHSAGVTVLKVTYNGCKILSSSADGSLVFHDVAKTDGAYKVSRTHHQMASHGTVYDMDINHRMKVVVTVGQDKMIKTFDISSGKLIRSFNQDKNFGDPIRVTIDPSCSYIACTCSNNYICIYDFINGEMVSHAMGHSEVVTGVIFLPDCKRIASVDGDGCIFIWRIPTCLTSRMLQKMKEISGPLSPRNLGQPVSLGQIVFCDEGGPRGNHRDELLFETSNQVEERVQSTPVFRFSISRLPKWAQVNVGSSDSAISINPEFSALEKAERKSLSPLVENGLDSDHVCLDVQTPYKSDLQSSESHIGSFSINSPSFVNSQSSSMPEHFLGGCAPEKHWRTVYTVCLDLLNSPDSWDLKDTKRRMFTPKLFQDPVDMLGNVETPIGHIRIATKGATISKECVNCDTPGLIQKNNYNLGKHISHTFHEAVTCDVMNQLHSVKNQSKEQAVLDVTDYYMKCEDTDIFKQQFRSLSTMHKTGRRKASLRRYSARYIVQQEYLGACKTLFNTPIQDPGFDTLQNEEESDPQTMVKNPAIKVPKENSCHKELATGNCSLQHGELTTCSVPNESVNLKLIEAKDQKGCMLEGSDGQTIIACREVLLNLNAAAENAIQLFSKLGTTISADEQFSGGPGAQLYEEAAQLLPSISEKVSVLTKAIQRSNMNLCGSSTAPEYESMLGTFAECLSQKVVEILKNNLSV